MKKESDENGAGDWTRRRRSKLDEDEGEEGEREWMAIPNCQLSADEWLLILSRKGRKESEAEAKVEQPDRQLITKTPGASQPYIGSCGTVPYRGAARNLLTRDGLTCSWPSQPDFLPMTSPQCRGPSTTACVRYHTVLDLGLWTVTGSG